MENFVFLSIIIVVFVVIIKSLSRGSNKKSKQTYWKTSEDEVISTFYYVKRKRENLGLPTKSMYQMRESLFRCSKQVAKKTLDEIAHQTRLEGLGSMKIKTRSLLNGSEAQMFYQIMSFLKGINTKYKRNFAIYPQVSLRSFILEEDAKEFWYIAGNRYVDFVVVDSREKYLYPKCVIEYFGSGHFGDSKEDRDRAIKSDEIKQAILKKIDLPLIIIQENDAQWKELLEKEIMRYK